MDFKYINISSTGTTEQVLSAAVADSDDVYVIERLLICNTDTTVIKVNLWLDDGSGSAPYILKAVEIPVEATLDFLNGIPFNFKASHKLALNLTDNAYTADVICNIYKQ